MILLPSLGLHPTLGALGRMSLHLSSTLVSHSWCLGPHDFTLVSHSCMPHLSPALVSHSGCLGPHEFTLVSTWGEAGRAINAGKGAEIIFFALNENT